MEDGRSGFSFFFACLFFISAYIYWRHREFFPVKGRDPRLQVVVGVFTGIVYFNNGFLWDWYPCALKIWLYVYCINGSYLFYTIRTWNLLFRYEITDNLLILNQAKREGKSTDAQQKMEGWYLRHRHLILPKYLAMWIVADYIIQTLYLLYATLAVDPAIRMEKNCELFPSTLSVFTWNTYLFGPRAIIVAWLAWRLKSKVSDSFRMKRELKMVGAVVVVDVILVVIIQKAAPGVSNAYHLQYWIGIVAAFASIPFGFVVPVWDYYKFRNEQIALAQSNLTHLSGVLSSDIGFRALLDFLTTEFSTENLFCWRECHDFLRSYKAPAGDGAQSSSVVEAYGRAKEIYDTYIDPDAKYEVNLGSELRNKLRIDLDAMARSISCFSSPSISTRNLSAPNTASPSASPDNSMIDSTIPLAKSHDSTPDPEQKEKCMEVVIATLSEIRKALYDLMNDDSFKRFLNSHFYTQLQDDIKEHFLSKQSSDISDEISKYASQPLGTRSGSSANEDTVSRPYSRKGTELQMTELQASEVEAHLSPKKTPVAEVFPPVSEKPETVVDVELLVDPDMTSSRDGLI